MSRQAFLLGLFATGAQTLILRELISCLNGSELFIGTALFGWLIWVACGAYLGGRLRRSARPAVLFATGALALPLVLVICRLFPLLITDGIGEFVPFTVASIISILAAFPHGVLSGLLFTAIVREVKAEQGTILKVYLIEGLGACVAGVAVTLAAGNWISSLTTSVMLSTVIVVGALSSRIAGTLLAVAAGSLLFGLIIAADIVERFETVLNEFRYKGYKVVSSFDTPYTRQTILERDSSIVLMTDNTVEATYPDIETSEHLLLPAKAYVNSSIQAVVIGRTEFGISTLADSIGGISIVGIDPRRFPAITDSVAGLRSTAEQITRDIIQYLGPRLLSAKPRRPDAVIVPLGDMSSFRISRLMSDESIGRLSRWLSEQGLLVILTRFDTDRYVAPLTADILGTLRTTLAANFTYVSVWPGTSTLLLASNANWFAASDSSLFDRLDSMIYRPQFIHEIYLADRLNDLKVAAVTRQLENHSGHHTIDRPALAVKQALYHAKANPVDQLAASAIFTYNYWLLLLPAGFVALLSVAMISLDRKRIMGMTIYIVAGFVSFVSELLVFYLYQCNVGSLHAEMAALIGVFMLGLASGTFVGSRCRTIHVERASLVVLLVALGSLIGWKSVWPEFFAAYAFGLMLITAMATGGLFVAATRRYYTDRPLTNRGAGYSLETAGSAIGALLTTAVLLPTIGLNWILISCLILVGLTLFIGLVNRPSE